MNRRQLLVGAAAIPALSVPAAVSAGELVHPPLRWSISLEDWYKIPWQRGLLFNDLSQMRPGCMYRIWDLTEQTSTNYAKLIATGGSWIDYFITRRVETFSSRYWVNPPDHVPTDPDSVPISVIKTIVNGTPLEFVRA